MSLEREMNLSRAAAGQGSSSAGQGSSSDVGAAGAGQQGSTSAAEAEAAAEVWIRQRVRETAVAPAAAPAGQGRSSAPPPLLAAAAAAAASQAAAEADTAAEAERVSVRLAHVETGHSGLLPAPELRDGTLAVAAAISLARSDVPLEGGGVARIELTGDAIAAAWAGVDNLAPPLAAAAPLGAAAGASMVAVYSDHNGAPLAVPRWISAPAAPAAPIVVGAAVPQIEVPGWRIVEVPARSPVE